MVERIHALIDRFAEVEQSLNDPSVVNDPRLLREASREYKSLLPIVTAGRLYLRVLDELRENRALIADSATDQDMRDMAYEDCRALEERKDAIEAELTVLLIPRDPNDFKNCIMELRAGTGGDEAALFVGDLFRMYQRFCERRGWTTEVIDITESERGGFKEITFGVNGDEAYGVLKYESGVHRVQRVPETETQGRIHTSAATVAVLLEAEEVDVQINESDLRIDIFRSGGKGGQNVIKVETAVRIVHNPTGIVVQCQNDRSQHRNRAEAMTMLKSRLYEHELRKRQVEQDKLEATKTDVGWGHQIRSYVLDQSRIKDLRTNIEISNTQKVLDGDLDPFIEASLKMNV